MNCAPSGTTVNAVSDSDIVIDWLQGTPKALEAFAEYDRVLISIVTWMEALVGAPSRDAESATRAALAALTIVELSGEIAERTVVIRQITRLKLPDAIILATARSLGLPLLTRNTRDFDESDPMIRVPYTL